jgi:NAD(P)-dependent dehydrogenase (short-subunit alcohol dehydrogenase family)
VARSIVAEGGRAVAVEADVTEVEACARIAQQADEEFGRVDALVNCAGIVSRRGMNARVEGGVLGEHPLMWRPRRSTW